MRDKRLKLKGLAMKKLCLIAPALWILLIVNAFSADIPPDIQKAFDNRQYDLTIQKIEEALKKDQRNADLYFLLGKSHEKRRQLDKAIEAVKQAVSIKGKLVEARYLLGQLYLETQQYDLAKNTFEDGLKKTKDPREIAVFEDGLGLYYLAMKDYLNADVQFRKAQISDPTNITYIMHQGDASFEQGIYAVALNAYQKALASDTLNAELWYRLSKCYLNQKLFKEALEAIDKTLALDSGYTEAYIDAGNIYTLYAVQQTSPEQQATLFSNAIFLYDKYLAMTGDSGIANYYRGKAYFTLNDFENAVRDFESCLRIGLDKPDLLALIGKCYSRLKQYDKAVEFMDNYEKGLLQRDPEYQWTISDIELFIERGKAYSGKADSASRLLAMEDFNRALALDSTNAMVYYYAGLNLYYLKDYPKALEYFLKHIELSPENLSAYINIGYSYMALKNWEKAIEYINASLEKNSQFTDAYKLLATLYFQKPNYDSSLYYYNKAREINPSDCEIMKNMGTIYLIKNNPNATAAITELTNYQNCLNSKGKSACEDIEVYVLIVKAYQIKNDIKKAFEKCKDGLKCNPNHAELKKIYDDLQWEVED